MATPKSQLTRRFLATPAGLTVHLKDHEGKDEEIKAKGGVMMLADHHVAEINQLVEEHGRIDFRQSLRELIAENIDKAVTEHRQKLGQREMPAAVQGPLASENQAINTVREVNLENNRAATLPSDASPLSGLRKHLAEGRTGGNAG